MMKRLLMIAALPAVLILAIPGLSRGDLIVYGQHSDYTPISGSSLTDVRLSVTLSVTGQTAYMTFANVSISPEASAVFKEIVVDGFDENRLAVILWNPRVVGGSSGVNYNVGLSNGLPGYPQTHQLIPLIELDAKSSPVKNGLAPGEWMQVQFDTSLAGGSTIQDYLAAFGGGSYAGNYTLGFHAISAAIVNGQSLSGMNTGDIDVPEPACAAALGLGGLVLLIRRRRQRSPAQT